MIFAEIPSVDVNFLLGVCFLIGLAIIVVSSWFLMGSLRARSSKILFLSSLLLFLWILFSDNLFFWIFSYFDSDFPYPYLEGVAVWAHLIGPGVLALSISISFAFVTRAIATNPRKEG